MSPTAHRFSRLLVDQGDTIEQWGYEPDDIVDTEVADDPRHNGERKCLHVWVLAETEVDQ